MSMLKHAAEQLLIWLPNRSRGNQAGLAISMHSGYSFTEWLCGHLPFVGTEYEVAIQQIQIPPPALHESFPAIPLAIRPAVRS